MYQSFSEALQNSSRAKYSGGQNADPESAAIASAVKSHRKKVSRDKKTQALELHSNVFDFPPFLWDAFDRFVFAKGPAVSMAEFVANRANPDFLRDFRKRNENQPTLSFSNESGDVVTVNKEFLCSIGSAEEGGEDDEEEEKREYDFLAMNSELSPENYDFSDPAALLRRQRELLKEIEDQKAKEESVDVFALLR